MKTKGYVVNGSREMAEVGIEALEALTGFLASLGEDAEVAEFRVYENMPVEALIWHNDAEFTTYAWTREKWVFAGA